MSRERSCLCIYALSWSEYKPHPNPRSEAEFSWVSVSGHNAKNWPIFSFPFLAFLIPLALIFAVSPIALLLQKCNMLTSQIVKMQQRDCTKPLSPPSPPSPLPRVRVRCPRLRSALTFSPGTIGRPGRTFYGKRLAGKGSDGGIGAVGVVTAKLVSGNRHRAYSLNSSAFGIIVILSLPEGGTLPYKSLHTSSDPACPPD